MKVLTIRAKKPVELHYTPFDWECPECGGKNKSTIMSTVIQYGAMNGIPTADVSKSCSHCDVSCAIELSIP